MNLLIKLSKSFLIILCTLTLFTSCDKDKILKACSDAEFAILTSSRKFNGKYTYEIKYAGHSIYNKNYGTI